MSAWLLVEKNSKVSITEVLRRDVLDVQKKSNTI